MSELDLAAARAYATGIDVCDSGGRGCAGPDHVADLLAEVEALRAELAAYVPAVDFAGDQCWLSPEAEVRWVDYGHSDHAHTDAGWRRLYVRKAATS